MTLWDYFLLQSLTSKVIEGHFLEFCEKVSRFLPIVIKANANIFLRYPVFFLSKYDLIKIWYECKHNKDALFSKYEIGPY